MPERVDSLKLSLEDIHLTCSCLVISIAQIITYLILSIRGIAESMTNFRITFGSKKNANELSL